MFPKLLKKPEEFLRQQRYFLVFLILLIVLPPFLHPYVIHTLIMFLLFAYLSTAWTIVGGFANQLSLGHSAFFGLGAYASTLLFMRYQITPWVGMFVGALLAAALSMIIGFSCFKAGVKGPYFVLFTMALAEIMVLLFTGLRDITYGSLGIFIPFLGDKPLYFQFASKVSYYWIMLILWLLIFLLTWYIETSKHGYFLMSIREDEDAAKALGVNVTMYKILAFMISAFFTALAGSFYAQYFLYIDPESVLGLSLSFQIVLMANLGGCTSYMGPTLGAAVLIPISELLRVRLGGTYAGLHLLLYGTLLVVIVRFMPQGLVFYAKRLLAKLTKRRVS